ncbi:unnamed protein product [Staurois parvus]|uniref:Uncharacterized protein n=1 Tax=Staurois parvus TaxID=386267 RepID=A0ABN9FFS5_9NEOB|nr:unnamed protein product [Staurois parvus]
MQLPVIGCTFLTLSQCEESTTDNQQLSEDRSAPIIRALMISALMISAQQCHCASSAIHLCPAVLPQVPHQCHPSVPPISAAHQCPATLPVSAQQCRQSVPPISVTYQCRLSVPIIVAYQLPPHQCHLSVLPIGAH